MELDAYFQDKQRRRAQLKNVSKYGRYLIFLLGKFHFEFRKFTFGQQPVLLPFHDLFQSEPPIGGGDRGAGSGRSTLGRRLLPDEALRDIDKNDATRHRPPVARLFGFR